MPSQRSLSLSLHTGAGTNWCTLGATEPWWVRLEARSSFWTSGTFRAAASSSASEEESQAFFWEFKNELSLRRMMLGDGDLFLTSCSSTLGRLELETAVRSIQRWVEVQFVQQWAETTCSIQTLRVIRSCSLVELQTMLQWRMMSHIPTNALTRAGSKPYELKSLLLWENDINQMSLSLSLSPKPTTSKQAISRFTNQSPASHRNPTTTITAFH